MPIVNDTLFEHPTDGARVWRYMDVSKLVSFLDTRTLFFARADRFDDKWEGSVSPNDVDAWNELVARDEESQEDREKLIQHYRSAFPGFRRHTYISCWHENDGESAAMWKLYLKSDEGIALQTSFGRLRHELNESARRIHLGRVQYIDYTKELTLGGTPHLVGRSYMLGPFAPFIQKRLGFSHEKEIRGVFQDAWKNPDDPSEAQHGLPIAVNVEELVEGVYVAPGTQGWLRSAVQSILKRFGIDQDVHSSEFDGPPVC
jgi:hypothetical protein